MIELPEAICLSKQINNEIRGRRIIQVLPPTKKNKFCWFCGEPDSYDERLRDAVVICARGFGIYVEFELSNSLNLCVNDGISMKLLKDAEITGEYQLAIIFDNGWTLLFTVTMYGGIYLYEKEHSDLYYTASKNAVSPFSDGFPAYFYSMISQCRPTNSVKQLLSTNQRFPGIGNGALQDILFNCGLNPKRKLGTLDSNDTEKLLQSIKNTLSDMIRYGGRDTEKNIYGENGGYRTKMSRLTVNDGCPICRGDITKESYLGGSVYYCANCQR